MEVIETYGADALRFNIITGNSPGNDMRYYNERCEAMRNFANKIWNASRFVLMNLTIGKNELPEKLELEDKWILSKLNSLAKEVNETSTSLSSVSPRIKSTILSGTTIVTGISAYKAAFKRRGRGGEIGAQKVLLYVLTETLKLLHPFIPLLPRKSGRLCPRRQPDD